MPRKTIWTDGQDMQIRRLRTEGASWDVIALALGLARWTVIERGRVLGASRPPAHVAAASVDLERPPLFAGHSDSWDAINRGTSLESVRFRSPGTIR